MQIYFKFDIGRRVQITALPGEVQGYIDSASVNQTGGITYYVKTDDKATSGWYAEGFLDEIQGYPTPPFGKPAKLPPVDTDL